MLEPGPAWRVLTAFALRPLGGSDASVAAVRVQVWHMQLDAMRNRIIRLNLHLEFASIATMTATLPAGAHARTTLACQDDLLLANVWLACILAPYSLDGAYMHVLVHRHVSHRALPAEMAPGLVSM
jgi:fatty-acid desaturase